MRVHRIVLENPKDFQRYYEVATDMIIFETKAVFAKGEEIILEFDFPNYREREHLRVTVKKLQPQRKGDNRFLNRVMAWVQPNQRRKLDFLLHQLSANEAPQVFRRNYTRHPVALRAAWSLADTDLWHPCEIRNMGLGGMMISASSLPSAGARICMQFVLPSTEKMLRVVGKVVWLDRENTGKYLMGIQFLAEPAEEDLLALQRDLRVFFRRHAIFGNVTGQPNPEDVEYHTTSTSGMN